MRYFEDFEVGSIQKFGSCLVTRDEVLDFASKYDPQPFHLSDEAAAQTHFGRISASGWHTCAMTMRMVVEHFKQVGHAGIGSPGVDEIRWLCPVYPGDTLSCEIEVLETRPSRSKPGRGVIRSAWRTFNQNGEQVISLIGLDMLLRRPVEPAD